MIEYNIKPLDFVRPKGYESDSECIVIFHDNISFEREKGGPYPDRYVGLVTEVSNDGACSVEWLGDGNRFLKCAWWNQEELVKEDSLPNLLAREMAHPFGNNRKDVDKYYPKNNFEKRKSDDKDKE